SPLMLRLLALATAARRAFSPIGTSTYSTSVPFLRFETIRPPVFTRGVPFPPWGSGGSPDCLGIPQLPIVSAPPGEVQGKAGFPPFFPLIPPGSLPTILDMGGRRCG